MKARYAQKKNVGSTRFQIFSTLLPKNFKTNLMHKEIIKQIILNIKEHKELIHVGEICMEACYAQYQKYWINKI